MAMPRLADLVNKMNFQGRLATSAIQSSAFPTSNAAGSRNAEETGKISANVTKAFSPEAISVLAAPKPI